MSNLTSRLPHREGSSCMGMPCPSTSRTLPGLRILPRGTESRRMRPSRCTNSRWKPRSASSREMRSGSSRSTPLRLKRGCSNTRRVTRTAQPVSGHRPKLDGHVQPQLCLPAFLRAGDPPLLHVVHVVRPLVNPHLAQLNLVGTSLAAVAPG